MIVRVENGVVREVRDDFIDAADAKRKAPLPTNLGEWRDADATVKDRYLFDGVNFTPPPGPTVAELKDYVDSVARQKIAVATGSTGDDFVTLRHQVSVLATAVLYQQKDRNGKATAKQIAALKQLEALGDRKEAIESARDKIKLSVTETTTKTEIDKDVRWPT